MDCRRSASWHASHLWGIGPDLVKKWALAKLAETAVDMIEAIIPIIFISKILIFHNQGHSQLLGLGGRDLLSWLHQRRSSALCCQRFCQSPSHWYNGRRIGFCNILWDSNLQVGDFLSSVLNKMATEGKMRTHKTWNDSGLKWTNMVGFWPCWYDSKYASPGEITWRSGLISGKPQPKVVGRL